MEPFDSGVTEINNRRTLLGITVFILWICHILKRAQLIFRIRVCYFIHLTCGKNTDGIPYRKFGNQNVAIKKSPGIRTDSVVFHNCNFRETYFYLIYHNTTYADRCSETYTESLLTPNNLKKPIRWLVEAILKLNSVLVPTGITILKSKSQHDVSDTSWLDHKNKLTKMHATTSSKIKDYFLGRFYTALPGGNTFGFPKETSEKRPIEYTIAYHTVQHFQHMSSSGSSSFVSNSAVQCTSKPLHRSTSAKKQLKESSAKVTSKHNPKDLTSPRPSKTKSTTSKAKDVKASSTTKSSAKPKVKKKGSKADTVTGESKIKTAPKRSLKREKIIGSVGPTSSMCYFKTAQSSSSFAKPLIKLPKKKSMATNKSASDNVTSKTHKKVSAKKLRPPKKSASPSKESHPTRILNPSLMLLLPDDIEHPPVPKSSKPEVYRPAFCKSLQTIPEDTSVNLTARQLPGSDYMYGCQPHFWSLPNECFQYAWPMLSQPFCRQQSCPYVAPYQARPVMSVNAKYQNVGGPDRTPSQIFFLANHLDTAHHTSERTNEKRKEKHKKKKGDKKKHSKSKKQ